MKGVNKILYQKNLLNVKTGKGFCYEYIMLFKKLLTFTIIVVSAVVVCSVLMVKVMSWILIITIPLWRTIRLMQPFYCFYLCESLWQTFNVIIISLSKKKIENHLARESVESDVQIGNSIVPRFVLSYLKCSEQDSPLFCIDQVKYSECAKNLQQYVDKIKFTKFDMTHNSVSNRQINKTEKEYKMINKEHRNIYHKKEKHKPMQCMFRTKRLDFWVGCNLMIKYFKTL